MNLLRFKSGKRRNAKNLRSYRNLGERPTLLKSHTLSPQRFKPDRLIGFTCLPIWAKI